MDLDDDDLELLGGGLRSTWSTTEEALYQRRFEELKRRHVLADRRRDPSCYTRARERRVATRRLNRLKRIALNRESPP